MTEDQNSGPSKLILVVRKKNGRKQSLSGEVFTKKGKGEVELGPHQGKETCTSLPVEHYRNSMKCAVCGLCKPSTWLHN